MYGHCYGGLQVRGDGESPRRKMVMFPHTIEVEVHMVSRSNRGCMLHWSTEHGVRRKTLISRYLAAPSPAPHSTASSPTSTIASRRVGRFRASSGDEGCMPSRVAMARKDPPGRRRILKRSKRLNLWQLQHPIMGPLSRECARQGLMWTRELMGKTTTTTLLREE